MRVPKKRREILEKAVNELVPFYQNQVPIWKLDEKNKLEKYTPSQKEVEDFFIWGQVAYLGTHYLFHPVSLTFAKDQQLFDFVDDPHFLAFDAIEQRLSLESSLDNSLGNKSQMKARIKEIRERHQFAIERCTDLIFMKEAFLSKISQEKYGGKVVDFFLHNNQEAIKELANMIGFSDKVKPNAAKVDKYESFRDEGIKIDSSKKGQESLSVTYASLWEFISNIRKKAGSVSDYIPEIEGEWKTILSQIIDNMSIMEREIPFVLKAALSKDEGFHILNTRIKDRLANVLKFEDEVMVPAYLKFPLIQKYNQDPLKKGSRNKKFFIKKEPDKFSITPDFVGDVIIQDKRPFFKEGRAAFSKISKEENSLFTRESVEPKRVKNDRLTYRKALSKIRAESSNKKIKRVAKSLIKLTMNVSKKPTQEEIASDVGMDTKTLRKYLEIIQKRIKNLQN